jgi:glycosyltransferase involved in cell wall biosynthesis
VRFGEAPAALHVESKRHSLNRLGQTSGDLSSSSIESVTICIPAYNEGAVIADVIKEANSILEQAALHGEILVIDDGSVDETWKILSEFQQIIPALQIRRHETNKGIAATFRELYQWATSDLVFLNSADGQWKMRTLLELLPMAREHDIIIAQRIDKHYRGGRRLVSWLFNALPVVLFSTPTYDAGSVKLVRREVYDIPLISSGVFNEAERIIRARRRGFRVGVKQVEHFPRRAGKASGAKPWLVAEAMIDLLKCWFDIVVLRRK